MVQNINTAKLCLIFPQSVYFYIALYNGDVFVQFNQGSGVSDPIRTRGEWHADGFVHRIVVEFTTINQWVYLWFIHTDQVQLRDRYRFHDIILLVSSVCVNNSVHFHTSHLLLGLDVGLSLSQCEHTATVPSHCPTLRPIKEWVV